MNVCVYQKLPWKIAVYHGTVLFDFFAVLFLLVIKMYYRAFVPDDYFHA